MNSELKAMLKEAVDLVAAGKAAVGKQWAALFGALVTAGEDVPAVVANWSDGKAELEALLKDPTADADLLTYTVSLIGGESAKAQAVIVAACDLILTGAQKGAALAAAIQAAKS